MHRFEKEPDLEGRAGLRDVVGLENSNWLGDLVRGGDVIGCRTKSGDCRGVEDGSR